MTLLRATHAMHITHATKNNSVEDSRKCIFAEEEKKNRARTEQEATEKYMRKRQQFH